MSKTLSSKRWLKEHFTDDYVKRAQKEGYRSRAAYKLLEIQKKDNFIKPGMTVVDLGAAPGGFTQVALKFVKSSGKIFALDLLPIVPIDNVEFIQGDFTRSEIIAELLAKVKNNKADVVLSDMSPNISGIAASDQAKSIYLAELALEFVQTVLKPDGVFLVKLFQGIGFDEYLAVLRQNFKKVVIRKPKASRDRSKELYVLAVGRKLI